jgi:hypothetical protein
MAPALLPPRGRGPFALGIAVGLLPILPFVIADPQAFIGNILLFNLARSADATSWLHDMPGGVVTAVHLALATFIAAAAVFVWRRAPSLTTRSGLAAMLGLCAILAGPGAHHNYQLWWMPFYAVLLARLMAQPAAEACQATPFVYTSAADLRAKGS